MRRETDEEIGWRFQQHHEALDALLRYIREHRQPDPPEGYPEPADPTTKTRGRRSLKGLHKPRDQR